MGKRLSEEVVVSDSDESMEDAPETTNGIAKDPQQKGDSASKQDTASRESGSASESESESDSSEESTSENENSRPSPHNNKRAFLPPSGFKQSKPKTRPSPAISSALSNLEGKQVFHITAPSSLSISRIKEISLGKAILGEPILSHKGVDYGLVANTQQQKQGSEALLVYDEATNTFVRKQELKNIECYNIQEIVRLPGLDSTQAATKKQSKIRPQPKHLRMRFHPVGSLDLPPETVGSSSEAEEQPTFRVPRRDLKEEAEKELKRKADNQGESEAKSKKSKKEKPSSQETDTRRDKEKKSSKHRDETSQERRARKEEKKRRKAEKGH